MGRELIKVKVFLDIFHIFPIIFINTVSTICYKRINIDINLQFGPKSQFFKDKAIFAPFFGRPIWDNVRR